MILRDQVVFQLTDPRKYAYIDILRGIAILLVIASHTQMEISGLPIIVQALFNYGQIGVQLFFIASAVTLCLSMRERNEHNLRNFYIRRFFRIAPTYYFAIILYFAWRLIRSYIKTRELNLNDSYNFVGLLENIFFLHGFDPRNFNYIVPGGWSIATEMTFYVIFPGLYFLQNRYDGKKFARIVAAIIFMSFLAQFLFIFFIQPIMIRLNLMTVEMFNDGFGFLYASLLNQIGVFLIGILAFRSLGTTRLSLSNSFLIIALNISSCYLLNSTTWLTGMNGFLYPLLSALSFFIIVTIIAHPSYNFNSAISRHLVQIGRVSYSMYILHFIIIDFVRAYCMKYLFPYLPSASLQLFVFYAMVLALTFLLAQLTFKFIEKPGISYGNKFILTLSSGASLKAQ